MLAIRDLIKIYPGPVAALRGISLDVPVGLFGLLGPNGAGKSTFMNILAGLLEPTGGTVHLDGHDVVADPRAVWNRLGYLPQDFGLYPSLTGTQMLDFMLRMKGVRAPGGRRALVGELLERVNLTHAARRKVRTYSGGMRQRLGIAQAIAGDARLVIVDEPTAGLDPEERHRFYRLLAELGRDRIVILSTHIVEDVATLCPRFAVIRHGRCVRTGRTAEARQQLEGRVFEGVVSPEALETLRREHRVTQAVLQEGREFRVRVQAKPGQQPAAFVVVPPTLEDVYFSAMQESRDAEAATLTEGASAR